MKREVLYENKWLRTVKLDDWFVASEPAASKGNMAVAVLPYREVYSMNEYNSGYELQRIEFLARFELNPAHMTGDKHQLSIITGACETGDPRYHARMELREEGGYDIAEEDFQFLGVVNPIKASCTKLHLYAVKIYDSDEHFKPSGDGGVHEQKEYAKWVSREEMIGCKDPYVHTIMMRGDL